MPDAGLGAPRVPTLRPGNDAGVLDPYAGYDDTGSQFDPGVVNGEGAGSTEYPSDDDSGSQFDF